MKTYLVLNIEARISRGNGTTNLILFTAIISSSLWILL
jgi:hypothetical protein